MRKKLIPMILTSMMLATACVPAVTSVPAVNTVVPLVTNVPTITSTPPIEDSVNPKLAAASFKSETYINEEFGFALDYPAGWTVNDSTIDDRPQIQFLSSPEISESGVLPEGASRVIAVIYDWEPKNDLPAFIAYWKTTWESSGFTIVEEQPLVLDLGLNAVQFTIKTPDSSAVVLITTLGDQYMILSGEGDLELAKEIVQRLRPISP